MTTEHRLEKRNKRLTVALTMMAVAAITIQLSACGDNPAGPSTNCDVSDVGALAGRNLSDCDLADANLESANLWRATLREADLRDANLSRANLKDALNVPQLSAKQEEDAYCDDCGEYCHGLVGAWNRKGMGRELKPGP